jgi:hypothetical protein
MASVTIARVQRASGLRFKAILRDELGHPLKSKTFTKLTLAREWARRLNSDRELVQALGTEAATLTLAGLIAGDPPYRPPFTVPDARQWQVDWWKQRLGNLKLVDITADDIRLALNEYGAGTVQVHVRGKGLKDTGRRRSPASVNRLRAMLAAMYRHGRIEWGFTADSPLRAVPAREERNRRRVFLSVEQAGKLLEARARRLGRSCTSSCSWASRPARAAASSNSCAGRTSTSRRGPRSSATRRTATRASSPSRRT